MRSNAIMNADSWWRGYQRRIRKESRRICRRLLWRAEVTERGRMAPMYYKPEQWARLSALTREE